MKMSRRAFLIMFRGQLLLSAMLSFAPAMAKDGGDDSGSGGSDDSGSDNSGSGSSGTDGSSGSDRGSDDDGSGSSGKHGSGSNSSNRSESSSKREADRDEDEDERDRKKPRGRDRVGLSADAAKDAVRSGSILPLSQVLPVVRRQAPGRLLEVNLLRDSEGEWLYVLLVLSRNGTYQEVTVNGRTRAIISVRRR